MLPVWPCLLFILQYILFFRCSDASRPWCGGFSFKRSKKKMLIVAFKSVTKGIKASKKWSTCIMRTTAAGSRGEKQQKAPAAEEDNKTAKAAAEAWVALKGTVLKSTEEDDSPHDPKEVMHCLMKRSIAYKDPPAAR